MPVVDLFSEKKYRKICTKFGRRKATFILLLISRHTYSDVKSRVSHNTRVVRLYQANLLQFYYWQMGKNIEQLLSLCRFFSLLLVLK
jgi:hypothetical protein